MLLGLIRHGITDYNVKNQLQGWLDIPLNEEGKKQAYLIEHITGIKWSEIITSDLLRAMQTAQIISDKFCIPITKTAKIRERNFGVYEGRPLADCTHIDQSQIESKECFENRVYDFMYDITTKRAIEDIIIVSHQGVLKLISKFLGEDQKEFLHTKLYTYFVNSNPKKRSPCSIYLS